MLQISGPGKYVTQAGMANQQAVQIIENFLVRLPVHNLGFYDFIFINEEHETPLAYQGHDFVY